MAEGADAPQQVLHFGQAAVKRLRTMTRRRTADPDTGLVFIDRVLLPAPGLRRALCWKRQWIC